jgi:hypothetical protein
MCVKMGWLTGFEPATPRTTTWCSNRLSYSHRTRTTRTPAPSAPVSGAGSVPSRLLRVKRAHDPPPQTRPATTLRSGKRDGGGGNTMLARRSSPRYRPAPQLQASVAQPVEQRILNPRVEGSIPSGGTTRRRPGVHDDARSSRLFCAARCAPQRAEPNPAGGRAQRSARSAVSLTGECGASTGCLGRRRKNVVPLPISDSNDTDPP